MEENKWIFVRTEFVCEETGEKVIVPKSMTSEECKELLLRGERP